MHRYSSIFVTLRLPKKIEGSSHSQIHAEDLFPLCGTLIVQDTNARTNSSQVRAVYTRSARARLRSANLARNQEPDRANSHNPTGIN